MTTLNPPSEDALRILEDCPAIFVNAFLYHFSDVAKIVLCEQLVNEGRVTPRACVLLSEQNARFLIEALQQWLDKKAEYAHSMGIVVPPGSKPN